jgi:hypothetical protein
MFPKRSPRGVMLASILRRVARPRGRLGEHHTIYPAFRESVNPKFLRERANIFLALGGM